MTMQHVFGLGVSPDVLFVNGTGYIAFRAGDPHVPGTIEVWTWSGLDLSTLALVARWDVPEGMAFPKVGRLNGEVCVGYTYGGWGVLQNLVTGVWSDLRAMENNDPCTFGNESPWFAWQGAGSAGWPILRLDSFDGEAQPTGENGRATGLSRVLPEGTVILVDEDGTSLRQCWSGDLRVWQGAEGGTGVQIAGAPHAGMLWPGQDRVTPRCASDDDEIYAIAYWSGIEREVVLTTFTREELLAVGTAPVPQVPTIGRPLWCGFFEFTIAVLPRNCQLPVDPAMIVHAFDDGTPLASYVSGEPDGDLDSLEARIVEARQLRPNLPVLAYWTRQAQAIRVPRGADIVGVEMYRRADESLTAFEARCRAALARVGRACIVAQCYTSNPGNTTDVVSLVPVYARLARDCSNVEMILAFSGSGRATGYQDHPDVWPLWQQLAAGIPGTPALPSEVEMPKIPTITIHDYARELASGVAIRLLTMTVGDTDVRVTIAADGQLTVHTRNPAGADQTGARRIVRIVGRNVVEPPPPPPPPPPDDDWETMVRKTIRAIYQGDNRPAPSRAEEDVILERCYAPPRGDGWHAEDIATYVRGLERQQPGPAQRRSGVVRLDNRCFADNGGPFLALGASLFWLVWGYKHDRERLIANLTWLSARGVDYIRALGVVGPRYWTDRTIDPNDPDYLANLVGAIDLAWEHGLRTQLTMFGGVDTVPTPEARRSLVDRISIALRPRREQIMFYEVANEHWQNGFEGEAGKWELIQLGRILQETGNVVALSAAEDPNVAWLNEGWSGIATVHYDRAEAPWRPVRQPWGYPGEYAEKGEKLGNYHGGPLPTVAVNNEPIGPQSSVASDDDPFSLAFAFVTTFLSQNGAYCLHTGAGVQGGGAGDRAKGRAANVWEVPNIEATLAAFATLRAALPMDLPNWTRANAQWTNPEHPFAGFKEHVDSGAILRSFATMNGQEFWFLVLDLKRDVSARARRACTYEILDVRTCAVVSSATVAAGETRTFSRALGLSGLLVRGRWV